MLLTLLSLSAQNHFGNEQRSFENRCLIYKFSAPPNHIVIVTFDTFSLAPKQSRCIDFLRVYDDTVNGLINENSRYSGEYCGNQVILLCFISKHRSKLSSGFKGTFRFVSKGNFRSNAINSGGCRYLVNVLEGNLFSPLYPHQYPPKSDCSYELPPKAAKRLLLTLEFLELAASNCYQNYIEIFQLEPKTGIINSATLFQKNINSAFKCTFIFKGSPEEQVQITFLYFNLYLPSTNIHNDSERCKNVDRVLVYVRIGKGMSLIGDFCGRKLPPRIMSVRNYLELIYEVRSPTMNVAASATAPYAFKLRYDFRTDLGLAEMNGERNKSKECYYVFRSTRQKVGNIQSPNYPGLYPRMIYCHYVFYGLEKEIVIISFENFDVEGLPTCEEESSDYVLFSNYQTDDRTNRKFCGQLKPTQPIKSESNYFRMTFRSNSMFDGYGFYAHYQLIYFNNLCIIVLCTAYKAFFVNSFFIENNIMLLLCLCCYCYILLASTITVTCYCC
uniref:CUB domain-containing protein n=1 Tax=Syphacia muris TaxID=451379 RepID=A0A0N5AIG0_9BILA